MATVYKIEIETVSPWVSHPEEHIKELFEKFLEEYEDNNGMGFESTEVEVKRIA